MDHVEVTNETTSITNTFYHANWLNTETNTVTMSRSNPMVEWKVTAVTGDAKDGGFDGDVFVTLQVRGGGGGCGRAGGGLAGHRVLEGEAGGRDMLPKSVARSIPLSDP